MCDPLALHTPSLSCSHPSLSPTQSPALTYPLKTAILGAGVSGLALARLLIERGVAANDLHLFEAAPVVGGLCLSKTVNGFTYDISGGHILFSKDAEVMQWMKDVAGGDDAFVSCARNTKIRFDDRWVHYPFENGIGDLPDQANFECLKGYIEAWHARKATGSEAPGDFASWIQWRFGDGIAKHFMDPYNEKIWKRPLSEITSSWVAGRVPDAPIEDILKAAIGMRTEGYTHQSSFFYPKKGGFQAITDGMGSTLGSQTRLSTRVETITRNGDAWKVNGEDFDRIVSTLPLNELPDILDGVPTEIGEAMRGLAFNSIVTFLVALNRAEHPDLSWIYLPQHKQGPVNRATYMSNYSPGNAPEGKTSFLLEVTVPGGAPSPGKELEREVMDGVISAGLLKRDEVMFTDRSQCKYAYIVYDHQLAARREASLKWCEDNGVELLGRFGHYDYFNSDQCVIAARALADRLAGEAARG
ncbi:MAG: protoporphyrinogen oxidase [Planctomycetota bacterium]